MSDNVTQADKDAASQFLLPHVWPEKHAKLAQAFARHRTSSPDAVEALIAEREWHEDQHKQISKQPNANVGQNGWMRVQHQERIDLINTALGEGE